MKSTINKKIIMVILLPFLMIYVTLLIYITYSVTQYVTNWTELELKGISEINATDLAGRMDSVRISVLSAARILDVQDSQDKGGRIWAENIIKSMFENEHVYNSWLAYEPEAFDGRDSEHGEDYPGAPSGRFIRSYIIDDGQIVTAPDMDENSLDNPEESPWYVIPRDTGRLYIDIDNSIPNLYDYGLGSEPVYTLSIVAPIHKDGRVIGCVGADVLFDVTTFGLDNNGHAAVAVFYPNGRIFYSQNLLYAEESVDTLLFTETEKIREAMSNGRSLFLPKEYSIFLDSIAFTYFQPVGNSDNGGNLFLYTAKPINSVYNSAKSIFVLVGAVAVAVLILVLAMFLYLTRKISRPLQSLTMAADSISQGDLDTGIATFADSKDEIGILSRSLHRMVEQFRVYIMRMEQSQGEMAVVSQLDDFIKSNNTADALNGLMMILCRYLSVCKASLVFTDGGRARLFSHFDFKSGTNRLPEGTAPEFMFHTQVEAMIAGKMLLYMNSFAIERSGAGFLDKETLAACIVPIWANKNLCGYVIFENSDENRIMNVSAQSILNHVTKTLADWWIIKGKLLNKPEAEGLSPMLELQATEPLPVNDINFRKSAETINIKVPNTPSLSVYQGIAGLDAESAILAMGGLTEVYEQSVKLLARLLPETESKLSLYLRENLNDFAIEIHGLKGSLNNVGAYALGDAAACIEQAAKAGDNDGCLMSFPSFREQLLVLHKNLTAAVRNESKKLPGDSDVLTDVMRKAAEAAESFDALDALELILPLTEYSFDPEIEILIDRIISSLEIFDCEKALNDIRTLLQQL